MRFNRRLSSLTCSLLLALPSPSTLAVEEDEIVTSCHFANAEWGSEMIDRCIRDNQATRALVLQYPDKHKAIIDRFGRFPHRNAILGRTSTSEEIAFLKEPGSSF